MQNGSREEEKTGGPVERRGWHLKARAWRNVLADEEAMAIINHVGDIPDGSAQQPAMSLTPWLQTMLVQVGKNSAYILNLRFCSAGIFYVTLIYLN